MELALGCDHAAFEAKELLKKQLQEEGHIVHDVGTYSNDRCNYPDFAQKVAHFVSLQKGMGILICGSGVGVSMVANRFSGVRAALCRSPEDAKLSREHNDSNVLCLGARTTDGQSLFEITKVWLASKFEGSRHSERIAIFNDLGEQVSWGMNWLAGHWEKLLFYSVMAIVLLSALVSRINKGYYEGTLAYEDGFLEYSTVIALVAGALACLVRLKKLWKDRGWVFRLSLIVLALLFIFGAGEEISWGQRIFGYSSSQFFAQNNTQGETNLHNLIVSGVRINKVIFGTFLGICVAFYLLLLPTMYRKKEKLRALIDRLGLPMAKGIYVIAYIVLALAGELSGSSKKGEILEFGGCWIFLMIILWPYNGHIFRKEYKV